MGLSFISLHVFSGQKIDSSLGSFVSYSEGWQTLAEDIPAYDEALLRRCRRISKLALAPVLLFQVLDSDCCIMNIYSGGKDIARLVGSEHSGMTKIPALLGFEDQPKNRLREIISCTDAETQCAMLEEYFGLCLLPLPELSPEEKRRSRDDKLYRAWRAEEKQLFSGCGRLKTELIQEIPGMLHLRLGFSDKNLYDLHYFGYQKPGYEHPSQAYSAVCFRNGRLEPVSEEELSRHRIPIGSGMPRWSTPIQEEYFPVHRITLPPDAPENLAGRTLKIPDTFMFCGYYKETYLVLANGQRTLILMNSDGRILFRMRFSCDILDYADGHVLTCTGNVAIFSPDSSGHFIQIHRISVE